MKTSYQSKKKTSQKSQTPENSSLRLQKFLAECGIASRRQAEVLIANGEVMVNGSIVTTPGTKITRGVDEVRWKGTLVSPEEFGVLLLHKPDGVISTKDDPQGRTTVMDYIPESYQTYAPVGRLDYETTGLMIFTNDGELANHLLHPRYEIPREYHALVFKKPSAQTLSLLSSGVELEDGLVTAKVKVLEREERGYWLQVVLSVGKNRIVRRLLKAVGHPVHRLLRFSHGPVTLGDLPMGKIRKLSRTEYLELREELGLA